MSGFDTNNVNTVDLPKNSKLLLDMIEQSSECTTKGSNVSTPRNSQTGEIGAIVLVETIKHPDSNSDRGFEEEKKVFESNYQAIQITKNKKTEKKYFSKLIAIDRDAFGDLDGQVFIMKQFWNSRSNKIIVAQKKNSNSISGFAVFFTQKDGSCYLMRIGVRSSSQRKGVGKLLVNHLLKEYDNKLELEVSSDNTQAIKFYLKIGLKLSSEYMTNEGVSFSQFSTM